MNTKYMLCLTVLTACVACSCAQKIDTASSSTPAKTSGGVETHKQQDGLSFETAVVLEAKSQVDGIAAQHAWIEKNLPGARPAPPPPAPKVNVDEEVVSFAQEVIQRDGKLYSLVHLQMPDGRLRDVHFDITRYFGK
jgi:hypothetical protein